MKRILDRDTDDPVYLTYKEMGRYDRGQLRENVFDLRKKCNLPLSDDNISVRMETMVESQVKKIVFTVLSMECQSMSKTNHLKYERLEMCL